MTFDATLLQQQGEDFPDWKLRLIVGKFEHAHDLDWVEIRDLLSLDCSPDHLRKTAYGVYETYKHLKDKTFHSSSDELLEIKRERMMLSDERRLKNADIRYDARFEVLREEIQRMANNANKVVPLEWKKPKVNVDSDYEALLSWNDWHIGLKTENRWNVFNKDIARKRVSKLVEENIKNAKMFNAKRIHVFINGDMQNGHLHITTRIYSDLDVVEQTQIAAEWIAEGLCELANEFEDVQVYFAKGNHDRTSVNKKDEVAKESFFEFIPWYLKIRLSNVKNITLNENEFDHEIIHAVICGKDVFAVHGHRDNIKNVIQNITLMTGIKPYRVLMAHYHHFEALELHDVKVYISNSLSGVDRYALENRLTGHAGQLMFIYKQGVGEVCMFDIDLGKE